MSVFATYWGEIAGLLSAVSAACSALMARSLGRTVHPVAMNAIRCVIAAFGFAFLWAFSTSEVGDWQAALPLLLVSVLGGLIVGDSLYLAAITRIGPARASPLAMSFPLPTAVLSVFLVGETVSALKAAGIVVGVAGIWLIATRGRREAVDGAARMAENAADLTVGTSLAIAASLCWAVSIVALKPALELVSTDFANMSRMVFAGAVLSIASWPKLSRLGPSLAPPSMKAIAFATGIMSVFTTALLAQCVLLAGASTGSLMSSMTPIFAAPMAWLLLGEKLTFRLVAGICFGIASIAMVTASG